jgi:hypothetical protein
MVAMAVIYFITAVASDLRARPDLQDHRAQLVLKELKEKLDPKVRQDHQDPVVFRILLTSLR